MSVYRPKWTKPIKRWFNISQTLVSLKQILGLKKECDHLEKLIKQQEQLIKVIKRHHGDTIELEGALQKLQFKFHQSYINSLRLIDKIEDAIRNLECADERLTLRLRYIEGLEWFDVVEQAHWSRAKVFRIHREALKKINRSG